MSQSPMSTPNPHLATSREPSKQGDGTLIRSRSDCVALDRADPLASQRQQFVLPPDSQDGTGSTIYLDGNSLGALPRHTPERVSEVVEQQWGRDLIRSWNQHGWIDLADRVAAKIAALIGAKPGQVMVADSTSVNLFKLLAVAFDLAKDPRRGAQASPRRTVVLSERGNFPSDLYIMQGLSRLLGTERCRLELIDSDPTGEALATALAELGDQVAVVALTHVDFRTGALHDMAAVTSAVHEAGALMLWDLAHSAGALPVHLDDCEVDFAVGCGYKYLNGGPGAPAFLYVAERWVAEPWRESVQSPLSGWLGHRAPFEFDLQYQPADGVQRFVCGTPPILSLTALDAGLDVWRHDDHRVDLQVVRDKSMRLGQLFLDLVQRRCSDFDFEVACPSDPQLRGSQVSLRHAEGYAIMQALIDRGVIGDFRAPDLLRFGLAPLYLRYVDMWDAVECLRRVMEEQAWRRPQYRSRSPVT